VAQAPVREPGRLLQRLRAIFAKVVAVPVETLPPNA